MFSFSDEVLRFFSCAHGAFDTVCACACLDIPFTTWTSPAHMLERSQVRGQRLGIVAPSPWSCISRVGFQHSLRSPFSSNVVRVRNQLIYEVTDKYNIK